VFAAGVDTRIGRAADGRVRRGVTVARAGTDLSLLVDLVRAVLVDAWIGTPTERRVRSVLFRVNVDDLRFWPAG